MQYSKGTIILSFQHVIWEPERYYHYSTMAVFPWLESHSERRFRSRSKTWLGSWFELRAFTCIANAFPITIRICTLRGNILLLLCSPRALIDPCAYAWLQRAFLKCTRTNHEKQNFFRVSKAWFETALRSHGLKSGFQIRKGPNHVLKRLSECDSSPCEHSHCSVEN